MKMYHSRISSPHQIKALPEKHAVVLTFGEATRGTCAIAKERLRNGGFVMLDNGAFSAFKRGEIMTTETVDKILTWYSGFLDIGGHLMVVAPDSIGNSEHTKKLQKYASNRLRDLTKKTTVIVPVQGFDMKESVDCWEEAKKTIGDRIVAGIPSKRAAWSEDQVREFVHLTGSKRVHFLGGSSIARRNLAAELGLEASSDSGFAVIASANTPERMANLAGNAALAERRVAGIGKRFFVKHGQTRWPWSWGAKS